jgi:hypothetical protein
MEKKIKKFAKKRFDVISALLMGIFTGICVGSGLDSYVITFGSMRRHYPYRAPFNDISLVAGFILAVAVFVAFCVELSRRDEVKNKILRFFIVCFAALVIAFLTTGIWLSMIALAAGYKRA